MTQFSSMRTAAPKPIGARAWLVVHLSPVPGASHASTTGAAIWSDPPWLQSTDCRNAAVLYEAQGRDFAEARQYILERVFSCDEYAWLRFHLKETEGAHWARGAYGGAFRLTLDGDWTRDPLDASVGVDELDHVADFEAGD